MMAVNMEVTMPIDKVIDGMKTHLANVKIHHERGDQAKWLRVVWVACAMASSATAGCVAKYC